MVYRDFRERNDGHWLFGMEVGDHKHNEFRMTSRRVETNFHINLTKGTVHPHPVIVLYDRIFFFFFIIIFNIFLLAGFIIL